MSARRYAPGRKPMWHISVLSKNGQRLLFHAECEDRVEVRALATEARHRSLGVQIWITPPGSQESEAWN